MSKTKKVLLNGGIFLLLFAATIYGVFHGEDLGALKDAILQCRIGWLLPGVVCVFLFIWGESIVIWDMMRSYGITVKKRICFLFSTVGFFFSCVTPSATGGQPMQIYFMKKEKIPVPISTVILMIVTITYKMVLVLIGLIILFFARGFLYSDLGDILFVFYLGLALNVFCVIFMIILVFHPVLAKSIMVAGLKLLEKLHILKHKEGRLSRLEASMDLYQETASYMKNHMGLMTRVMVVTIFQRIALFAVTYFVYRGFGLHGIGWLRITALQAVIAVSVDMLPLPGGMGISETLFLTIFKPVFGAILLPGMILSRGLSFYSELIISAVFTMFTFLYFANRERRAQKKTAA